MEAGQPLYTLATDKTETEIESPIRGRISIIGEAETSYPVGAVVATIE